MMLWGKQKKIEALVIKHLNKVVETLDNFQDSLYSYLDGDIDQADRLALATHKAESRADDIRREVEAELLGGALLAPSRRNILEIIERVDGLANAGEAALDYIMLQHIQIPNEIKEQLHGIGEKTGEISREVKQAMQMMFDDIGQVTEHTKAIEIKEGEIDRLERDAIKIVFEMDIDLAEKLQLRGMIEQLVEISDRAEDLSDRIDIVVVERKL